MATFKAFIWPAVQKSLINIKSNRFGFSTASSSRAAEDQNQGYEDSVREKILAASLNHVPHHGWSHEALAEGARSLGYPGVTAGLFQKGPVDLIFYFYEDCNKNLNQMLESELNTSKSRKEPPEIVEKAIENRLRMIVPFLERWPQALGIMSLPSNVPVALSHLLTLVDDICYHAGDRSVDFNWYSRRLAVGGIYKMTELYLIQDKSPDFKATWEFLHRRMDEAVQIHSVLQAGGEVSTVARDTLLATFTTARNILRLNRSR